VPKYNPDDDPTKRRIDWARSLTNEEICVIIQSALHESRSAKESRVSLLNELAHEIRHRLSKSKGKP